jgi:hypothetical protein
MDLNIRIIHHRDFLQTTPSGTIDLKASKQILLKVALANQPPNKYDVLLDIRGTTSQVSIADVTELVRFMMGYRESFYNKIALLANPDSRFELAKFMEVYAQNRGFKIAAFDNFEEAIDWLSTATDLAPDQS